MSNTRDAFDAVGVIVDWIDACKKRRLSDLVKLYDDSATVDCQGEGRFEGRTALRRYLRAKLQNQKPGAFAIDALVPEAAGVCLHYRDCDGQAVRTHFRFSPAGKIVHTASTLVAGDGASPIAA